MTGAQHYAEAEALLAKVTTNDGCSVDFGKVGEAFMAAAQVHATLAVAATLQKMHAEATS